MALSAEDMKYLGKEFEEIKTASKAVETTLKDHIKNPCPNMTKHWKGEHKGLLLKVVSGIVLIVALLSSAVAFVQYVSK